MHTSPEQQKQKVLTRINGKVYDFTDYADIHPGGADAIRSLHNRDSTLPFLHTHGRDKNAMMMIRAYECKNPDTIKKAEKSIPNMARVDQRMVELYHKYDGKTFMKSITWHVWQPVLAMCVGVYLLHVAPQWTKTWWIGIAIWTWAIVREADLSHNLSHNSIFDDPKKNRWYNEWHVMLVNGINGRLAFREHPKHHASTNILGYDPALNVPVKWREDAPAGLQSKITLPRGPVFFFGSLFLFPWTTVIHSSRGLWGKIRMNRLKFCVGWAIRTSILLELVGPVAMIASYMTALGLAAFGASAQHFDQPVMLPEEYHQSKMSFVELQLRSVISWHANEGFGKLIPMIALDHIYHHLLPTIADTHIPQSVKDEIDLMIKEELGVVPVQRSFWAALLDAYKQYFGLTEQGSIKGFVLASKDDEGKGKALFKSVVRNNNDNDKTTVVETEDEERKVLIENVSDASITLTLAIVKKKEEVNATDVISVDKSVDTCVIIPSTATKDRLQTKPKLLCMSASAA
jgi:cytochrome b involved in lipid metabolism